MTTLYTGQERILRKRKRPNTIHTRARPIQRFFGNEKIKEFEIPSIAADYNDWMNGVDRSDQLRASQGYKHPYRRGAWQALAWSFLLEIMIGNSYSLQLYGQPAWDKIKVQRKWRELVIDGLIARFHSRSQSRRRYRSGDEITPISLHKRVSRGSPSACLACQGHRLGEIRSQSKRKALLRADGNARPPPRKPQSRSGCEQCNVALCNKGYCWDFYHHLI